MAAPPDLAWVFARASKLDSSCCVKQMGRGRPACRPALGGGSPVPLQNRVTPYSDVVAFPERGTLMGNRGVLHDEGRRIVRFSQGRRWIACLTEFRGRRRPPMTSGRYTELFFLDEATALAAG